MSRSASIIARSPSSTSGWSSTSITRIMASPRTSPMASSQEAPSSLDGESNFDARAVCTGVDLQRSVHDRHPVAHPAQAEVSARRADIVLAFEHAGNVEAAPIVAHLEHELIL